MDVFSVITLFVFSGLPYYAATPCLSDNTFMVRERMTKALFELGAEGHPVGAALEYAARYGDAEAKWRATKILDHVFDEQARRVKEAAEDAERRQKDAEAKLVKGWNKLADQLFPYYPYLDSCWWNNEEKWFKIGSEEQKRLQARYHNPSTRILDQVVVTDGRENMNGQQRDWQMSSKRMAIDALSRGVDPLTINLLFQVMRANDNLYHAEVSRRNKAALSVPEEMPSAKEP